MNRCLILAGGIGHPFPEAVEALLPLLQQAGFMARVEWDPAQAFAALDQDMPDLFLVYALRWRMEAEKYAPFREEWAFHMRPEYQKSITAHVERGGHVFALHTACICFDDWPGWGDVIGAQWEWGKSYHPPFGEVEVKSTNTALERPFEVPSAFTLLDEVYSDLKWSRDVPALMVGRGGADHPWQPVLWAFEIKGARIVVDTLGHDAASLVEPGHQTVIRNALGWLRGDEE